MLPLQTSFYFSLFFPPSFYEGLKNNNNSETFCCNGLSSYSYAELYADQYYGLQWRAEFAIVLEYVFYVFFLQNLKNACLRFFKMTCQKTQKPLSSLSNRYER